jgi:hypothetical protein
MEILEANTLGVKVGSGETILTKYLGAAKRNVVVTDNEEASLNYSYVQDAGVTLVDNSTAKLNWSTTKDMIGQSYTIWTKGNTVVYFEEGANTVQEYTAEAEVTAKNAGMKIAGAAEFINFADDVQDVYTTDIRITYWYDENGNGTEDANEIHTIAAETDLTDAQVADLHTIFKQASLTTIGYVAVGTKNVSATDDISNDISWSKFVKDYLKVNANNAINAKSNQNGNYIKVIDNDGDGEAEYILKTTYTMAAIESISNKGVYTLSIKEDGTKVTIEPNKTPVVTEDELAAGDVIVYTLIDGVYYANLAEVVTATTDKKAIDYKAKTLTCGDDVYQTSGITIDTVTFDDAFVYDTFYFDVTAAADSTTYDLYLDNYGYVRAFTENKTSNALALLTDGYYWTNYKEQEAQVDIVTADTEETTYSVAGVAGADPFNGFIDTDTDGIKGNRGTWQRLNGFVGYNYKYFQTNVASVAFGEDSVTLYSAKKYTNREVTVEQNELVLTAKSALSSEKLTAVYKDGDSSANHTVYATTDTVYYYVTSAKGDLAVQTWTGYKNAPSNLSLDYTQDHAYAVYTKSTVGNYYYADVVVIEASSVLTSVNFVYYANTNSANDASYWLKEIAYDDDESAWDTETVVSSVDADYITTIPAFYYTNAKGVPTAIIENFADYNIYAATSEVDVDVNSRDYVYMDNDVSFRNVPVYILSTNPKADSYVAYTVEDCDSVKVGNDLIYVTNGRAVQYAINVSQSTGAVKGLLETLFDNIKKDADKLRGFDKVAEQIQADLDATTPDYATLVADLEELQKDDYADKNLTGTQAGTKAKLIADLTAAIALAEPQALTDELLTTYSNYKAGTATAEELYVAANNYKTNGKKSDDADAVYTEAKALAVAEAAAIKTADDGATTLAKYKALTATDLSTAAKTLAALTEDTTPKASEYSAAVTSIAAKKALYQKAYDLVKAYDDWSNALPSGKAAAAAVYATKYAAITTTPTTGDYAKIDDLGDDDTTGIFYTGASGFKTAYGKNAAVTGQAGNISSVALKDAKKSTCSLEETADKAYTLTVPYGTATTGLSSSLLTDYLALATVGTDETHLTVSEKSSVYTITDRGSVETVGEATDSVITVTVVAAAQSQVTKVATVKGKPVTDGKVTLAHNMAGVALGVSAADITAAEGGTIKGISLDASVTTSSTIAEGALTEGDNTVYVLIWPAAGEDYAQTVSITITIQGA